MNLKSMLETKKQKIIALILAIVSVILCVTIVLLTVASCSGGDGVPWLADHSWRPTPSLWR